MEKKKCFLGVFWLLAIVILVACDSKVTNDMEVNDMEVDTKELVQLQLDDATEFLVNLRSESYGWSTAQEIADRIKGAVKDGAITWDELETNEVEIKGLVKKAQANDAKEFLVNLRKDLYNLASARDVTGKIRNAVKDGAITWDELETNEVEIKGLVKKAQANDAKEFLVNLRKDLYNLASARDVTGKIRNAVKDGAITWDELETNEVEIEKLVEKVR